MTHAMGGPHTYTVVWLVSFGDGKRAAAGHRVQHKWINSEAESDPQVRSGLQDFEERHGLEPGAIVSRFVAGNEAGCL